VKVCFLARPPFSSDSTILRVIFLVTLESCLSSSLTPASLVYSEMILLTEEEVNLTWPALSPCS